MFKKKDGRPTGPTTPASSPPVTAGSKATVASRTAGSQERFSVTPSRTGDVPVRAEVAPEPGGAGKSNSTRPRRRNGGIISAALLTLIGIWGLLVPVLGPYAGFAYGSRPWALDLNRLYLNFLPALAVLIGGLVLGLSRHRVLTAAGAGVALAGGSWLVVGPSVSQLWDVPGPATPIGAPVGAPLATVLEQLGYFYGVGAIATALAAGVLGRLTVRSARSGSPTAP